MERKNIMILVAVLVVIGVCVYFMMFNELNEDTFTSTHAEIFGTGGSEGGLPGIGDVSLGTTFNVLLESAQKPYLDPNRKIVTFDSNGDIDDSITIGDVMQNAYYLAAKAYLAAKGDINAAFSNAGIPQNEEGQKLADKISALNTNVSRINVAMVGQTYSDANTVLNPPPQDVYTTSESLRETFKTVYDNKYIKKGENYHFMIGPGNVSANQQLSMAWNDGMHVMRNTGPSSIANQTNQKFRIID